MHSLGRLLLIREHASHRVKCTAHCMEIVHIELRCMAERPSNRLWNILTNIIWSPSSSASARWAAIKHILSELRVREYNASSTARSTRHIKRNQTRSMVLNRASIHPWSIVSCSVCSLHCPSRHHRLNPEYISAESTFNALQLNSEHKCVTQTDELAVERRSQTIALN